jgi:hypothetical protein
MRPRGRSFSQFKTLEGQKVESGPSQINFRRIRVCGTSRRITRVPGLPAKEKKVEKGNEADLKGGCGCPALPLRRGARLEGLEVGPCPVDGGPADLLGEGLQLTGRVGEEGSEEVVGFLEGVLELQRGSRERGAKLTPGGGPSPG